MIRLYLLLVLVLVSCLAASMSSASADNDVDAATVVLSSYHVSTNVNSRLMNSNIAMVFENSEDCSSVYSITLQLPRSARVTDLIMDLSDGCQLESQVKNLDDAVGDFEEFSSEGKAAAILTAWDMSNYELKVSIPSYGTTNVLLKYQELLFQKLDRVSFQVPMFPGIAVDDLKVDISVEEPNTGMIEFQTEQFQDAKIETPILNNNKTASMHYEKRGVTNETSLPTLLQAHFRPGPPPENGLFLSDGECFTHIFNPTTFLTGVGSMARKIVFVVDVSGSMNGRKLSDVKASFVVMIDTLNERDTLIIQSFSNEGTESLWGPEIATPESKDKAKNYVKNLITIGGTNLNQAFLDGIANVYDVPETVASILVIMTDGKGDNSARDTARNVRNRNVAGKVKIFSLAFGDDADIDLLLGIAVQNGGRAVRIYEGFGDAANQMEKFYKQELGSILMSDVSVSYDFGEVGGVSDSTVPRFPVMAAGSEIVVRGRMDISSTAAVTASRSLKSVVSANSVAGPQQWPIDLVVIPENSASDCRQSFAQARIVELLDYRDANRSIGNELFGTTVVSLSTNIAASSFEEEARTIALDAHLVWPGLTALVTVENTNCQQNNSEVCYSGNGYDRYSGDNQNDEDTSYAMNAPKYKVDPPNSYADKAPSSGNSNPLDDGFYTQDRSRSGASRGWRDCLDSISLVLIVLTSMVLAF